LCGLQSRKTWKRTFDPEVTSADWYSWDKTTFEAAQKDQEEFQKQFDPLEKTKPDMKTRLSIAEQAKSLLRAEERWSSSAQWENVGKAIEVETNMTIPESK
jgi:hypothetical protein